MSATRSGSTQAPAAPGASGEPTTAFVVSGGASLGALQVGMLHALYERGIVPDLLVATSVGALNSAFVASRPQTVTTARELGRVSRNLEREDVFPVSMSALIGGFCGPRNHLVPDRGLRRLVGRHVEFEDLAGAAVPLHLVTFDLVAGRELLLSMGSAVEAVVAAASIPGVFPPVEIADRCLFDGGVVNNIPISHAVELGADRIVVLPTRDPGSLPERPPQSALDTALHGLGLLLEGRLQADIARYSRDVELVVLPAANRAGVQPTSFDHADGQINEALIAPLESSRGTTAEGTCDSSRSDRPMLRLPTLTVSPERTAGHPWAENRPSLPGRHASIEVR
ncbi:MAG: patatin-like phospholipase family protein [Solirubrobacteraceae bacterium]